MPPVVTHRGFQPETNGANHEINFAAFVFGVALALHHHQAGFSAGVQLMDYTSNTGGVTETSVVTICDHCCTVGFFMQTTQAETGISGAGSNTGTTFLRVEIACTDFYPTCRRVFRVQRKGLHHTTDSIGTVQ